MKKLNKLFVFAVTLFVGILTVNAGIKLNDQQCVASETSQNPQNCPLSFTLTESAFKKGDGFSVIFHTPRNIKNSSITITPETGWKVRKLGDTEYASTLTLSLTTEQSFVEFIYDGDTEIAVGTVSYALVQYDKEDIGEGCGFALGLPFCSKPSVDEQAYYFGRTGKSITKDEWVDQCTCQPITINGKEYYYGKAGDIKATKEEMLKECFSCRVENEKYYDKDGIEITEDDYKKQCMCRIEETDNGKVYYNNKNEIITAEEYANQCQPSVPTGASVPYIAILGGLAAAASIFFMAKSKSKFKRI